VQAFKETLAGFKATAKATGKAAAEPPAAFSHRGFGNSVYGIPLSPEFPAFQTRKLQLFGQPRRVFVSSNLAHFHFRITPQPKSGNMHDGIAELMEYVASSSTRQATQQLIAFAGLGKLIGGG
jgi:hypothetical protein